MYEPNIELIDELIEHIKTQIAEQNNHQVLAELARQLESYVLLKNNAREVRNG